MFVPTAGGYLGSDSCKPTSLPSDVSTLRGRWWGLEWAHFAPWLRYYCRHVGISGSELRAPCTASPCPLMTKADIRIARNYYQCKKRHPPVLFWLKAASSRLSVAVPVVGRFPKELFPIGDATSCANRTARLRDKKIWSRAHRSVAKKQLRSKIVFAAVHQSGYGTSGHFSGSR